ncbi:MAG: hypothetical protein UU48_C0001G0055 [Candidatus Uhrbacteria bacterium GW2011_GWF2_41_16]|uniref:Uncharacterized protein n=2 Tax=Candidatus Uhriibacteriota TaxID=1752732 RepID=A0A0G0XPH9_9BACT|nr:MAG: hypothetical protein UU31_C0002G0134 [Candidatus Uhrbacteria bacterium GW2011_GWA2_41_10]KKR87761.1 MAG: hypothetical protein UU35_C0001G0042 [Candidatus Uhrbacteria bacterium GW2011_GWC2_41_11]KKR98700.1 MAG: hypothetical protein UU48_C0001G0055 [Candidatus Uhrbacteria bacterium GW2011_GWF2_41_16]HBP00204.1 hypothetical protein [Candidatus Uhrbacteria bacterium]
MTKEFKYKFDAGPVASQEDLLSEWAIGNCRRAVQLYTFRKKNLFLKLEQVLCPAAYNETGVFVINKDQEFSFDSLVDGDIIYAEKIRNKNGKEVDKSENTFNSADEYIISLHTALYTGEKDREIWHATAVEGSSCFWPLEKFLHFYKPIVAKRV